MDNVVLIHRKDRMGSNFLFQMGTFLISKYNNLNLHYYGNNKYINNMYFTPMKQNAKLITDNNIILIPHKIPKQCNFTEENKQKPTFICNGVRGSSAQFVISSKQDIISYFNDNHKNECFKIIKEEANKKKFELPWKDNSNIICIHIRLDDQRKQADIDSVGGFKQYSKLIENDQWNHYTKAPHDVQCPINPTKLEKLLIEFKEKYPTKEIYLIMSIYIPKPYMDIIKKYNLKYFNKNSVDYDIWLMINCDILVLSKSSFPIIAAYYFQGSQIYYQIWPTIACLGIGTKYNKTNWIGFK